MLLVSVNHDAVGGEQRVRLAVESKTAKTKSDSLVVFILKLPSCSHNILLVKLSKLSIYMQRTLSRYKLYFHAFLKKFLSALARLNPSLVSPLSPRSIRKNEPPPPSLISINTVQ